MKNWGKVALIILIIAILGECGAMISLTINYIENFVERGWSTIDILVPIDLVLFILSIPCLISFANYFPKSDFDYITLSNDLYRGFLKTQSSGKLQELEHFLLKEEHIKCLKKINKIIHKKYPELEISFDNLNELFDKNSKIYVNKIYLTKRQISKIENQYNFIKKNRSKTYELLYREIANKELIRLTKFPVVQTIFYALCVTYFVILFVLDLILDFYALSFSTILILQASFVYSLIFIEIGNKFERQTEEKKKICEFLNSINSESK